MTSLKYVWSFCNQAVRSIYNNSLVFSRLVPRQFNPPARNSRFLHHYAHFVKPTSEIGAANSSRFLLHSPAVLSNASTNRVEKLINYQPCRGKKKGSGWRRDWYRPNAVKRIRKHSFQNRIMADRSGLRIAWKKLLKGKWYFGQTTHRY